METDNLAWFVKTKNWDAIYQKHMDVFRAWIASDKESILNALNTEIFMQDWEKYAKGTISAWEMEVLCFYYHEHELEHINNDRYGFVDFYSLPEDPVIEKTFTKGGKDIHIFKLNRICGTCIAKNKTKSTVTILTTTGVVNVKFRKEYFTMFDKQISERQADGTKKIMEKSWFNRGNMIVVTGIRSGDDFVSKKYASTGGHQLYKIDAVLPNGELILKDSRYQGGIEEDV
jgi:DNA polymerase-3 subunit alpha